jgi:hypothetical protein
MSPKDLQKIQQIEIIETQRHRATFLCGFGPIEAFRDSSGPFVSFHEDWQNQTAGMTTGQPLERTEARQLTPTAVKSPLKPLGNRNLSSACLWLFLSSHGPFSVLKFFTSCQREIIVTKIKF